MNAWISETDDGSGRVEVKVKNGVARLTLFIEKGGGTVQSMSADLPSGAARSMGKALIELSEALRGLNDES